MFKVEGNKFENIGFKPGSIAYLESDCLTRDYKRNLEIKIPAGTVFKIIDFNYERNSGIDVPDISIKIEDALGNQTTINSKRPEYIESVFHILDENQIDNFNDNNKKIFDNNPKRFNQKKYENSKIWQLALSHITLFFVLLYFVIKGGSIIENAIPDGIPFSSYLFIPIMVLIAFLVINTIILIHYSKIKKQLPENYLLYENYDENKKDLNKLLGVSNSIDEEK